MPLRHAQAGVARAVEATPGVGAAAAAVGWVVGPCVSVSTGSEQQGTSRLPRQNSSVHAALVEVPCLHMCMHASI
jgi:hypothetical protein